MNEYLNCLNDLLVFISFIIFKKTNIMGNILYIIAVILIIGWAIGFFGYAAGGLIHLLLVIAVVVIVIRLLQGRDIL